MLLEQVHFPQTGPNWTKIILITGTILVTGLIIYTHFKPKKLQKLALSAEEEKPASTPMA